MMRLSLPKVTALPANAFDSCDKLQAIELGAVTTIEDNAFWRLPLLNSLTMTMSVPPTVAASAFDTVPGPVTVYVKPGTEALWSATAPWDNNIAGFPTFIIRPVPGAAADIPKTGDANLPGVWVGLAVLSALGLAGSMVMNRRKRRDEN